jgi:hypothetical protein
MNGTVFLYTDVLSLVQEMNHLAGYQKRAPKKEYKKKAMDMSKV